MKHPLIMDLDSGVIAPCDVDLGLKDLKAEDGVARCRWLPSERSINANGVVQGGYIAAACDAAMGYAHASRLENAEGFTSVNLSVTYHRPLKQEAAEVRADVVRVGRRTSYVEATVSMEGRLVASAVGTLFIL
jgi:acyl-CoA thioesterase